mmetsp:Transcript_33906/g.66704  ORF Transcript_33906/g.66704 Transcript_33906/m.66704 type:complete len:304 (-) Transcript_33906:7-918(-)
MSRSSYMRVCRCALDTSPSMRCSSTSLGGQCRKISSREGRRLLQGLDFPSSALLELMSLDTDERRLSWGLPLRRFRPRLPDDARDDGWARLFRRKELVVLLWLPGLSGGVDLMKPPRSIEDMSVMTSSLGLARSGSLISLSSDMFFAITNNMSMNRCLSMYLKLSPISFRKNMLGTSRGKPPSRRENIRRTSASEIKPSQSRSTWANKSLTSFLTSAARCNSSGFMFPRSSRRLASIFTAGAPVNSLRPPLCVCPFSEVSLGGRSVDTETKLDGEPFLGTRRENVPAGAVQVLIDNMVSNKLS